jgi:hypothetical protein
MLEVSFWVDIISTIAIVIGVVFGLIQLRHYHQSRARDSALFLLNSYQTEEFLHGVWEILSLPDGLTKKEIEERVGDEIKLVYLVMSTWESIGILVFNREVALDMVDDAFSGPLTISWQKLQSYVSGIREEQHRETMFEWFQWLAERMIDREKGAKPIPAHIAYKNWDGA